LFCRAAARDAETERIRVLAEEIEADRSSNHGVEDVDGVVTASDAPGLVLQKHRHKASKVYEAFDLTVDKPTCKLCSKTDTHKLCGIAPAPSGGTSNYWHHLQVHHRRDFLRLKQLMGKLTVVGETELKTLRGAFAQLADNAKESATIQPLDGEAKDTMDRVVT
jgi:hypothetical protein